MKLTLKDFGPIDEFTLDLSKDIQFIYGENSVGKSYAVFVLYAVAKAFENLRGIDKLDYHDMKKVSIESNIQDYQIDIQKAAKEAKGKRVKINKYIVSSLKSLTAQSTKSLEKILLTKFSALSKFSNKNTENDFSIILDLNELTLIFKPYQSEYVKNRLELDVELSESWEASYDKEQNEFAYYRDGERVMFAYPEKPTQNIGWRLVSLIRVLLFSKINPHLQKTYLIPAQRTGTYLSTNSFAPVIAELSVNRAFLEHNKSIELAAFSKEVADYVIHLSLMDSSNSGELLMPFVRKLEKDILKGKIEFDDQRKRITYHPDGTDLALDLLAASSMIAEISIITAFFKYNIKDNGLQNKINKTVIIEEPESHLHPKTQVALMELFADLPKYGIKLIVTSHSDFMMDKLSNMILEGKVDAETVGSYRMVMGEKGSYDAGDMKASKDGIPDKNFVEISEKLYEERVDIYSQLNVEEKYISSTHAIPHL